MTGIIAQNVGRTSGLIKAASGGGGVWTLIKSITASSDSNIDFVDGASDVILDDTYPIYLFKFIGMHPSNNDVEFQFNISIDTGSNYNVTKTTTSFVAYHREDGGDSSLQYSTVGDLAQSTSFQRFTNGDNVGNDNDQNISGELWLFNPSSTVFIKHFMGNASQAGTSDYNTNEFIAGYCNTTSACDAVRFQFSAGSMDVGKIKLYGLKDSA